LIFVRAPDDPPPPNREYQDALGSMSRALQARGIEASAQSFAFDAVDGGGGLTGTFALIGTALGVFIGAGATVVAAWLNSKNGRKVRLKVGDIEVEAQTLDQVEQLIARAQEIQQSNKPKVIREP
jgi:hypothetical protein